MTVSDLILKLIRMEPDMDVTVEVRSDDIVNSYINITEVVKTGNECNIIITDDGSYVMVLPLPAAKLRERCYYP